MEITASRRSQQHWRFRRRRTWYIGVLVVVAASAILTSVTVFLNTTLLDTVHSVAAKYASTPRDKPETFPDGRENDYTDIFQSFTGRGECRFGALDLHRPVPNLCTDRRQLLDAMTDGSRPEGFNMPYEPAGCDLRFFRTVQICEILNRFEAIIFFGDSMVRHLEQAFVMLLRENYYNGGQGDWNDFSREHPDITSKCRCEEQNYSMNCIFSETNLEDIYENAPELILCPMAARPKLVFQHVLTWPLPQPDFDDLIARATASTRPLKPYAFILGHAGWNDVNSTATILWLDQVIERIGEVRPYLAQNSPFQYPMAFVSITAAGPLKPTKFREQQGNEAVVRFENAIRGPVQDRGVDFLGPYNMSRTARIPDGTHSGLRVNFLKAFSFINWLNMVDTRRWTNPAP